MTRYRWVLLSLLIAPLGTVAAQKLDCSWLLVDTIAKTATVQVSAGLTGQNGAMNFNGFHSGALTVTVPLHWNVVLRFTNRDGDVPHSAQVIDSVNPLPAGPAANPAFARAQTTRLMQGLPVGQEEELRFVASKPGTYLIWCPVPGHGIAGMWIRFKVSRTDARPTLRAPAAS